MYSVYKCFNGCENETLRDEDYLDAPNTTKCVHCGKRAKWIRRVGVCFGSIPPWMKAVGGSQDSCDRQAAYLKSERHRKDVERAERQIEHERQFEYKKQELYRRVADVEQRHGHIDSGKNGKGGKRK